MCDTASVELCSFIDSFKRFVAISKVKCTQWWLLARHTGKGTRLHIFTSTDDRKQSCGVYAGIFPISKVILLVLVLLAPSSYAMPACFTTNCRVRGSWMVVFILPYHDYNGSFCFTHILSQKRLVPD